jgi:hypothetical protein
MRNIVNKGTTDSPGSIDLSHWSNPPGDELLIGLTCFKDEIVLCILQLRLNMHPKESS